jgi:hypothetical protein
MPKFMLLQYYEPSPVCDVVISDWPPEDIQAHIDFQVALNDQLMAAGEFVDAQALTGPELAKFVTSDGKSAPVITDGPYAEAKELLAGYRTIDVPSEERALEIAAAASAAPGPNGIILQTRIEVRQVMGAPGEA